jgi:NAD(P)-dependent dehydrogenase (short-subunit alcohol dehydrogenase family)
MSILVIGGAGALGRAIISHCSGTLSLISYSVDFQAVLQASHSITLPLHSSTPAASVRSHLLDALGFSAHSGGGSPRAPFRAIVCTAGGWEGGGAGEADFESKYKKMEQACLYPALTAAALACTPGVLEPSRGLLILTGSAAALKPAPGMLAYYLAKASTHSLARAVGSGSGGAGGLPPGARALCLAPHVLDTPSNRKFMAEGADTSTWTPPLCIARRVGDWVTGAQPPPASGAIVEVVTSAGATSFKEVAL